jgi:nitrous oxidase accessory protein
MWVSENPHGTIAAAIAAATDGETVIVHPGIYQEGNSRWTSPSNSPVRAGRSWMARESGEVITITAPGVEISGFEVRNSGVSSLDDFAGIKVSDTGKATVSKNRLR